jgi:hypothetical protein
MRDITQIDFSQPHSKVVTSDPAKQKCFFKQDGVEYDSAGKACNVKQVKAYYAQLATDAQLAADEAKEAAANAQEQADAAMKSAGINKTAARKGATA